MRTVPGLSFVSAGTAVPDRTLTPEHLAAEVAWIRDRHALEMPCGMAWVLRLCRELREWDDDRADRWSSALGALERHALARFERYCSTLTVPVRGGLHGQSAFSLGLVWDSADHGAMRDVISDAARRFYGADLSADLRFEPSATDFLSPSLSEADLMRRILPATSSPGGSKGLLRAASTY